VLDQGFVEAQKRKKVKDQKLVETAQNAFRAYIENKSKGTHDNDGYTIK
jgi:hypothetical protein